MKPFCCALLWALASFVTSGVASAGALRVVPVTLDLAAPAATGAITLRNEGTQPANVQIRVFRWMQGADGQDALQPTTDVVASPPAATLAPGASYVVRVVRAGGPASGGEESYRLLIDELPTAGRVQPGRISLLVRQSIPVFFSGLEVSAPQLQWQVSAGRSGVTVTATNGGSRRQKIADMSLATASGQLLADRKGLAGYVLGGSSRSWSFPAARNVKPGTAVVLNAASDNNRIRVQATVQAAK
ncbi:molecular chaperone [Ancylobacter oerskovii]|uniref:Molecular chaperone n=1 Tax=Ancylobacter oerskovii TaxID=459519 RepID=A0ABW4Z214_9HYPH|nr:molecular chaperone [Ancylobacter oerskovii]MBS7544861.1 molecular chaperone [Ancylobacter oerskovii]